jgi:hypothetical protein
MGMGNCSFSVTGSETNNQGLDIATRTRRSQGLENGVVVVVVVRVLETEAGQAWALKLPKGESQVLEKEERDM